MIITRKIQVYINEPDIDKRKKHYELMRSWQWLAFKVANWIATHKFVQDNLVDFNYFTKDMDLLLADEIKKPNGILTMSAMNTGYELTKKVKQELPSAIRACLSSTIHSVYSKERKKYRAGDRSLRSYRKDMPVPFHNKALRNLKEDPDTKQFTFDLLGIPLKTNLGRDRSNNHVILSRICRGEYRHADSSFRFEKKKLYVYLCVDIPVKEVTLNPDKTLMAHLSFDTPLIATIDDKIIPIGNKEEYLHRRIAIQGALSRMQRNQKFNKCGKGRKKRMQAIDRYHKAEVNYIRTRLHQYSAYLIKLAIDNDCGNVVLANYDQVVTETHIESNKFLLRNWSYYGLNQMIKYKCQKFGIAFFE